jgi:hypothetical protein
LAIKVRKEKESKKIKKGRMLRINLIYKYIYIVPDFRTRSLPVLSPIASMFGLALVTYIITQLADFTAYTLPTNKMRDGVYSRLQKEVAAKEEFVYNNS